MHNRGLYLNKTLIRYRTSLRPVLKKDVDRISHITELYFSKVADKIVYSKDVDKVSYITDLYLSIDVNNISMNST